MSDLIFGPEKALPPSQPKPMSKVLGVLSKNLPGFFEAEGELSGVQTASIHFAGGAIEGISSEVPKHLHARSAGAVPLMSETDKLSIVSGICLFGEAGLTCYGPGGVPTVLERPGVSAPPKLPPVYDVEKGKTQLYVPESIARLGQTMVALTQIAANVHNKATTIFVHLPGPEYKIQAEVAYASGKVTLEALQKYYQLVDEEVQDAQGGFTSMFEGAGLQPPTFGSPLDFVVDHVEPGTLSVEHFKDTPFETIVDSLESMREVEHASEVAAYLQPAHNGNLSVFVDNHAQEKIFKVAKQQPWFKGIAIYPLPVVFSTQTKNLLYHSGASEEEIAMAVKPWAQA